MKMLNEKCKKNNVRSYQGYISQKKNYTRKCIRAGSYKPSRQLLHIHRIKKSVSTLLNALQKRKKRPAGIYQEVIRTDNEITTCT